MWTGSWFFRASPESGRDLAQNTWLLPKTAVLFKILDLSTPAPARPQFDGTILAEVAIAATGELTGFGLDLQFVPRAQIQGSRAGSIVANLGGEARFGQGLADRDHRNTGVEAPAWYFFVSSDNEALVWNLADKQSPDGFTLRDQATIGDIQAGLAWSTTTGGQASFGLVERKLVFNDLAGDHDASTRERFAALSFTMKR
jgi:hypothetical protein